ncbi:hypothetical protein BWI93_25675 [Siphonobacter sp. BAB-5385]|uniref:glycosyltransferase family 2 protein n=1 Tax=Siphonobacter sp. BAB-5385 TaxID=1864822 RepID=UPI000B9E5D76|nr:glycosyltransferase family A protein [Siphonobacter sp. BAB-5385]OZI05399.1 hypothetical protein BWI93_25675 [Siphonobacter sp. BAB-5385]
MSPLVSVIIPCYNSGTYLPEALASVEAYQGSYAYEIIIINDGSTDPHTLEYLRELETRGYSILHQENKGAAAARNTGVRAARGKYLLLLDSDNRIRPAYLEKGIPVLESRPDVGVVYGNAHFLEIPRGKVSKLRYSMVRSCSFPMLWICVRSFGKPSGSRSEGWTNKYRVARTGNSGFA